MKTKIFAFLAVLPVMMSCNDWLREIPAGTNPLEGYYVSGESCYAVVNGCYTPLAWELGKTYFSEWFIGDIASDDAIKGGENRTDMPMSLDIELFRVNAENTLLLDFYSSQYQGIARTNRAIRDIALQPTDQYMDQSQKDRLLGEAKFLRAFYYYRLVRVFGRVPYYTHVLEGTKDLTLVRASFEDIYKGIVTDLTEAEAGLWPKSKYAAQDAGRATKGAAQALLMKVYMTGREYLPDAFVQAVKWGNELETSLEYDMLPNYFDNFTLAGENGPESIFETQYTNDGTSDYGGFGYTRGTFTVILQRARARKAMGGQEGWGYNRPTASLIAEYETGDPRKDATIDVLSDDQITNPTTDLYEGKIATFSRKYAMLTDGPEGGVYRTSHATRGPINRKEIRYADALLMYAEALVETGDAPKAKAILERVRARARAGADVLPAFPNYNGYADTQGDLRRAIRHERRVELAMEGHRWFDLVRWYPLDASGNEIRTASPDPDKKYLRAVGSTMNAYRASAQIKELYPDMGAFVEGTHEIFPIPAEERRLAGIDQNFGY